MLKLNYHRYFYSFYLWWGVGLLVREVKTKGWSAEERAKGMIKKINKNNIFGRCKLSEYSQ